MTEFELQSANEHVKLLQRRLAYLRGKPQDQGFAKAEREALLWVLDDLLPLWVKAHTRKSK